MALLSFLAHSQSTSALKSFKKPPETLFFCLVKTLSSTKMSSTKPTSSPLRAEAPEWSPAAALLELSTTLPPAPEVILPIATHVTLMTPAEGTQEAPIEVEDSSTDDEPEVTEVTYFPPPPKFLPKAMRYQCLARRYLANKQVPVSKKARKEPSSPPAYSPTSPEHKESSPAYNPKSSDEEDSFNGLNGPIKSDFQAIPRSSSPQQFAVVSKGESLEDINDVVADFEYKMQRMMDLSCKEEDYPPCRECDEWDRLYNDFVADKFPM